MAKGMGEQEPFGWRCLFCYNGSHRKSTNNTSIVIQIILANSTLQLTLLRNLILWSLSGSEVVKGIIQAAYKQNRHEDDINQALSVQPWGSDSDKRRYYLIEGLDDTHFRVYRESNFMALKRTWFSVAGDIDELKALAEKLEKEDRGQKARTLSARITAAIPRFEATEDVCIIYPIFGLMLIWVLEAKTS